VTPSRLALSLLAVVAAVSASRPSQAVTDIENQAPPPVAPAWHLKFIPIPMYSTVPTEGSTYGGMPVLMAVHGETVKMIGAPSISWNRAAGVTGTLRYYYYPSDVQALSVIAAASTHVNRTLWITYTDLPIEAGRATVEGEAMVRRNIFFRFYGFGPHTTAADETSYTRTTESLTARWGWNLPAHLNAGVRGTFRGDQTLRYPIFGLPATQDRYPDAPGLSGGGLVSGELSLRFDTRPHAEYSTSGIAAELHGSYNQGLTGFDHFWQLGWQVRGLVPETPDLQTAGRVTWMSELGGGDSVPFYYRSALGGENLLRGFPENRFIDRAAWEAEVEQRIRLLQTHMFGVSTDWRVDPFVAIGQVYGQLQDIATRPQVAVGVGLRAWVKPNVLGRVDLAYASEGFNAYVVLGYPY
jgi:Omp85 superfamily domain